MIESKKNKLVTPRTSKTRSSKDKNLINSSRGGNLQASHETESPWENNPNPP